MTDAAAEDILRGLRESGLYRRLVPSRVRGARVRCEDGEYVNLASNDYLGISADAALQREFLSSLSESDGFLMGASSSRLLGGDNPAFGELEKYLSAAYSEAAGAERAALCFNCGYHANAGILPALAGPRDLVLYDRLSHASLIDSIGSLPCKWARFPHNDLEALRRILKSRRADFDSVYIATESVFSMDGDRADIRGLIEIKREFDCSLYVDEAHAVGVFGGTGLGLCEELSAAGGADFIMCTLGKAVASAGAYAVCSPAHRRLLINRCRTFIFTTALPPISVLWTLFIFKKIRGMSERRARLGKISAELRGRLRGLKTLGDTQIVPVVFGSNESASAAAEAMKRAGIWSPPVRHPTVPKNSARLRLSLNAALSDADLSLVADALNSLAEGGK